NHVPGVTVAWRPVDGVGQVTMATSVTDGDGRATTDWILGDLGTFDRQHLEATLPDAPTVTAASYGTYAYNVSLRIQGDGQRAEPGTAVAVAPGVTVTGYNEVPVSGADVEFAVTAGGGTIAQASAITNASGFASCGSWTLGNEVSLNSLSITVVG